eukprot:TRINITY_DN7482_c0_g1_i2.p1 TRINITY_DN7482_c0_g1~~TRINITY_DN7482_c0_g1_i2.p1  ORF type:complete len:138 (-),score=56.15 TRINITY_DN7482_c0_g1_i2:41-454(-)
MNLEKMENFALNISDTKEQVAKLEEIFKFKNRILKRYNRDRCQTIITLMAKYVQLENWERALLSSQELVFLYQFYYKKNWPLLGLEYFFLGKLQKFQGNFREAFLAFREAHKILSVTHRDTKLLFQLEEFLRECQME